MDAPFPFGFPGATARYLALYVGTLVLHVLFMNYVLAGALYVLIDRVRRPVHPDPLAVVLRDWLPFALSGAITAGVAPLLFVQVLYPVPFYTANLLLYNGWMVVLPVLIVAFYLLYLLKSTIVATRPRLERLASALAALGFVFVAFAWTENHVLSISRAEWSAFYEAERPFHWNAEMLPRLGVWLFGAFPTMALALAWQTRGRVPANDTRKLSRIAIAAVGAAAACGAAYGWLLDPALRAGVTGAAGAPYVVVAGAGLLVQLGAWGHVLASGRFRRETLGLASIGLVLAILGTAVARETIRLAAIDVEALFPRHARAASERGFVLFVLFLVLNSAIILGCIRLVRRAQRASASRG